MSRRTGLRLAAAAAVVLAVPAMVLAPAAGGLAGADTSTFVPGTGQASAQVINIPLALSGENFGVTEAASNAGYTNEQGQAQSQLLASALLGTLGVPVPAALNPLQVESTTTPQNSTKSLGGSTASGADVESVSASQSAGLAQTSVASYNVGNDIDIGAGQSTAGSSIINGATRTSQASVTVGSLSLLDGLVVLSGLKWNSEQSTGATNGATSSFSVASVKVAGTTLPISTGALTEVFSTVNRLMSKTGFHISLPETVHGTDGSVEESPLSIGIANSALGGEVVGPVITDVQPLRNAIFSELAKASSTTGEVDLFVELGVAVLAGQGTLDLDIGGTYASTNGTVYSNPFGNSGGSALSLGGNGSSTLGGASSAGSQFTPGDSSVALPTSLGASGTTTPRAGAGSKATGPGSKALALQRLGSSTVCTSITVGSCRSSSATPVAIALLVGTGGLAVAEVLRQRRRTRRLAATDAGETV